MVERLNFGQAMQICRKYDVTIRLNTRDDNSHAAKWIAFFREMDDSTTIIYADTLDELVRGVENKAEIV